MSEMNTRKRQMSLPIKIQTVYSRRHREYFESVDKTLSEMKNGTLPSVEGTASLINLHSSLFDFSFLHGISLKNIDVPHQLNLKIWDDNLILKHEETMNTISSEAIESPNSSLLDILTKYKKATSKCIEDECNTDNMCTVSEITDMNRLREQDDKFHNETKMKYQDLQILRKWFSDNCEEKVDIKYTKLVEVWISEIKIATYTTCSEKISKLMREHEINNIEKNIKMQLKKDPELYEKIGMHKKETLERLQLPDIVSRWSESEFRKLRARWEGTAGTLGFEGSANPTYENFAVLQKVQVVIKGDNSGQIVPTSGSNTKEFDIFTVDKSTALSEYLANPSYDNWKDFIEKKFIPGSAIFFHPNISNPPIKNNKPAFLAFITRIPSNCFEMNDKTTQGINMDFYILTWSEIHKEWYLGEQTHLPSSNSKQRRKIVLENSQAVLATQLPGKKNIDNNYINEIYYGKKMTISTSLEENTFD